MKRAFINGVLIGLLIFLLANLLAAHLLSDCGLPAVFRVDRCSDDIARAGWPLQFYEEGGFVFHLEFKPLFLIFNMWIGILLALVCGWLYARQKKTLSK